MFIGLGVKISLWLKIKMTHRIPKKRGSGYNYMTIKKATDILKKYNEWRRCSEMVNKHKCPPPKQIGEAIEVAVDFMANASSEN